MLGGLELNIDILNLVSEDKALIGLLPLYPWGLWAVLDLLDVEPCHHVLGPQFGRVLLFKLVTVYVQVA